jgi:hypothetical protein
MVLLLPPQDINAADATTKHSEISFFNTMTPSPQSGRPLSPAGAFLGKTLP